MGETGVEVGLKARDEQTSLLKDYPETEFLGIVRRGKKVKSVLFKTMSLFDDNKLSILGGQLQELGEVTLKG